MDNFDYPYYGNDYGYSSGKSGETTSSQDNSSKTETTEEALQTVLACNDNLRCEEIEITGSGFSESSKSTFSRSFSDSIPEVAFINDPMRASIHPLGPVDKPTGVSESEWKKLDADLLFPVMQVKHRVAEISEEKPKEEKGILAKLNPRFSSASSGGRGKDNSHDPVTHESKEMPFLDHLEELRWAILKSIIAIVIGMIASWYLSDWFYSQVYDMAKNMEGVKLIVTKVLESIILRLQMAFAMGLVLSLPFVFYFMWSFVSPGLYDNEKKWVLPLIFTATGCFFVGAALAWFGMIPYMLKFMQSFNLPGTESMITIGPFVSLILKFTLAFGVIFELPVIAFILAKVGILKHTFMIKYRKYAIVIIFIISAVITPTVDPISQTLMAIPLYFLYEVSIIVARIAGKKTLLG